MREEQRHGSILPVLALVSGVFGLFFALLLGLVLQELSGITSDPSGMGTRMTSSLSSDSLAFRQGVFFQLAAPLWAGGFAVTFGLWLWTLASIDISRPAPDVALALLTSLGWIIVPVASFGVFVVSAGNLFGTSGLSPVLSGSGALLALWCLASLGTMFVTESIRYYRGG